MVPLSKALVHLCKTFSNCKTVDLSGKKLNCLSDRVFVFLRYSGKISLINYSMISQIMLSGLNNGVVIFRIMFLSYFLNTTCISIPVGTARLTGENVKFSSIFGGETYESIFHRGDNKTYCGWWKSSEVKWRIYYADLKIYIPNWLKNIEMAEESLSVKKT